MLEDQAPDRDLHPLARQRRPPAAPEADHRAQDRDPEHDDRQDDEQDPRIRRPARRQPPRQGLRQRPPEQDVVDDQLRRRRRHQPQERGEREQPERQRDREPMPAEQPVQLAVEPAQRPVLLLRPLFLIRPTARRILAAPFSIVVEPLPAADPLAPGQCTTPRPRHFSSSFRTLDAGPVPGAYRTGGGVTLVMWSGAVSWRIASRPWK